MTHEVETVPRFVRKVLKCDHCFCNMLSHLLADMINDGLDMPSDYDLSEHQDYIRTKYSTLIQPFHLVSGEDFNSLTSNISYRR